MILCLICIRCDTGRAEFDMLVPDFVNLVVFGFVAFRVYLCIYDVLCVLLCYVMAFRCVVFVLLCVLFRAGRSQQLGRGQCSKYGRDVRWSRQFQRTFPRFLFVSCLLFGVC